MKHGGKQMKIALTIGLSLALTPAALAGGDNETTVITTLTKVRETPEAFKQVRVQFPVQFASIGRVSNPFFTRFVPSDYANFYCWAEEQPIWRKNEYENVFAYLFLPKDHEQLQTLYDLELYDRIMITGVVRNTFQGAPWIEVLEFEYLGEHVSTESLAHAYRGEQLMARRQWHRAISELCGVRGCSVTGIPAGREDQGPVGGRAPGVRAGLLDGVSVADSHVPPREQPEA